MATKVFYTADEIAPELSRRLGGLQALEVKEIPLYPLDAARKTYGGKYKNWNTGRKSAPILVYVNKALKSSGFSIPAVQFRAGTPDEYSVNTDGVVEFVDGQPEGTEVMATFTFRMFDELNLQRAVSPNGLAILNVYLPSLIDSECIPANAFEAVMVSALQHAFMSIDSEQNLYYSYSIQEQSHSLQQIHTNLQKSIDGLKTRLLEQVDSLLWFTYQGKSRRVTSVQIPDARGLRY